MKEAILNFLATRLGAGLAPVISGAIASAFVWAGSHIPYGIGAYLSTPAAQTAILGTVFGLVMVIINSLTVNRGFKYGQQVQSVLNTVGRAYGLSVEPDGVIGPNTAETAKVIAASVKLDQNTTVQDIAKDLNESPAAQFVSNPNRKG